MLRSLRFWEQYAKIKYRDSRYFEHLSNCHTEQRKLASVSNLTSKNLTSKLRKHPSKLEIRENSGSAQNFWKFRKAPRSSKNIRKQLNESPRSSDHFQKDWGTYFDQKFGKLSSHETSEMLRKPARRSHNFRKNPATSEKFKEFLSKLGSFRLVSLGNVQNVKRIFKKFR